MKINILIIIVSLQMFGFSANAQMKSDDIFKNMTEYLASVDTMAIEIKIKITENDSSDLDKQVSFIKVGTNYFYDYRDIEMIYEDKILAQIDHANKIIVIKKLKESIKSFDFNEVIKDADPTTFKGDVKLISNNPKKYKITPGKNDVIRYLDVELKNDLIHDLTYHYKNNGLYPKKVNVNFSYSRNLTTEEENKSSLNHYIRLVGKNLITTEKYNGYEIILKEEK